ncbi:MAG: TerD family protein [Lachnospiraceae bacterium]|nr:TerD family protein [Lachnospiraceae bacterium]
MINIPMKSKAPFDRTNVSSINDAVTHGSVSAQNVESINTWKTSNSVQSQPQNSTAPRQNISTPVSTVPVTPHPAPVTSSATTMPVQKPIPQLIKPVQKGQKVTMDGAPLTNLKACFGWNSTNAECDVDVSAFLLGQDGKVLGDEWFVFYGQTNSPDNSTVFRMDNGIDREIIDINLQTLNPAVKKIVFVLTINEAMEKRLHFAMMKDAYVRILNPQTNTELVSFQMTDYYNNVISMMIGEVYQHNGAWKFNAVGNGVAKDLNGLCELYGVQVLD